MVILQLRSNSPGYIYWISSFFNSALFLLLFQSFTIPIMLSLARTRLSTTSYARTFATQANKNFKVVVIGGGPGGLSGKIKDEVSLAV